MVVIDLTPDELYLIRRAVREKFAVARSNSSQGASSPENEYWTKQTDLHRALMTKLAYVK